MAFCVVNFFATRTFLTQKFFFYTVLILLSVNYWTPTLSFLFRNNVSTIFCSATPIERTVTKIHTNSSLNNTSIPFFLTRRQLEPKTLTNNNKTNDGSSETATTTQPSVVASSPSVREERQSNTNPVVRIVGETRIRGDNDVTSNVLINLLNQTSPSMDLDNFLEVFIKGNDRTLWGHHKYPRIIQLRNLLFRLHNIGIKTYWLAGSEELNVNQSKLEAINDGKPVRWIQIPDSLCSVVIHRVFVSSGREFDFFAQSLDEDLEVPFSYYMDRLLAGRDIRIQTNQKDIHPSKRKRGTSLLIDTFMKKKELTQWQISHYITASAIEKSPGLTLAMLENEKAVAYLLEGALRLAAGVKSNATSFLQMLIPDGHWSRILSNKGKLNQTQWNSEISIADIIDHYKTLGKLWISKKGKAVTTNVFYATARQDFRTLLGMARTQSDVDIVSHMNEWSLNTLPQSRVLVYLTRWRPESTTLNINKNGEEETYLNTSPVINNNTTNIYNDNDNNNKTLESLPDGRTINDNMFSPSIGFMDVELCFIKDLSRNATDLRATSVTVYNFTGENSNPFELKLQWRRTIQEYRAMFYLVVAVAVIIGFIALGAIAAGGFLCSTLTLKKKQDVSTTSLEYAEQLEGLVQHDTPPSQPERTNSHTICPFANQMDDNDSDILDIPKMKQVIIDDSIIRRS